MFVPLFHPLNFLKVKFKFNFMIFKFDGQSCKYYVQIRKTFYFHSVKMRFLHIKAAI